MYILAINIPYYPSIKEFETYEDAMEYVEKEEINNEVKEWANMGHYTSWHVARVEQGNKY